MRRGSVETGAVEPPQQLVSEEQVQRIRRALDQLPESQRWVVQQRFFQGRTFADMAAELNVPLGTVLTRLRLALGKLERSLQGMD
jgi:RNA polymerase sigma-70 factor (ECF subfamily)